MKTRRANERTCERGLRGVVLAVALMVAIGALSLGAFSQGARAATTLRQNGWDGNSVIYMTDGIQSKDPYVVPTVSNAGVQTASQNSLGIANAINVSAGQDPNTTDTRWLFREYFDAGGSSPYLEIKIPIVAGGGGKVNEQPPSRYDVGFQNLSLSATGAPWNMSAQVDTIYSGGLNVTPTTTPSELDLAQQGYDTACTFLPYVGYGCWLWDTIRRYDNLSAAYLSNNGNWGGGAAFEKFTVSNGSSTSNTFISQTRLEVDIPEWDFTHYSPVFNISGQNLVLYSIAGQPTFQAPGALGYVHVPAVPAVTLAGTVKLGTLPLAGWTITLQETYNGVTTNYLLTTNSTGAYRFFARLGTSYTLLATYGSTAWQNGPFTTASTATSQTEDLNIPALSVTAGANPNPTYPPANVTFWTSLWGGYISPVTYAWTFGDGTTGTGQGPYHVYTSSGTFTVNVTATDSSNPVQKPTYTFKMVVNNPCGGSSACISPPSQTVYYGICASPIASFKALPATTDGGPFTYSWNFGDGTTGGNYQIISHTYPYVQTTYTVTLTITDGAGVKSTATATVTVKNMGKICAPS